MWYTNVYLQRQLSQSIFSVYMVNIYAVWIMLLQKSVIQHAMLDSLVDPRIRPSILIPLIKRIETKEKFSDKYLTLNPCFLCSMGPQHTAALHYLSGVYKKDGVWCFTLYCGRRFRHNELNLKQKRFRIDENPASWAKSSIWTGYQEMLCSFHPWSFSKPNWI